MSEINHSGRPKDYAVCFRKDCPLAQSCLRQLTANEPCQDERYIRLVNPYLVKDDTGNCPFYRSNKMVRVAYGIANIFDNLPYSKHDYIFHCVQGCFGKSTYYRVYHKQRPIWPNEQEYIQQVFARNGITEPVQFEEYRDIYNW